MPAPTRRSGLWLGLAGAGIAALALALGWGLGQWQRGGATGPQTAIERQVEQLLPVVQRGEASAAEQQRLLELLLTLNRKAEATRLLEALADRQPERWRLRLLLAELRRDQNDRGGAERELRQLLALQPDRVEPLQLMALLLVETGRGAQAEAMVQAALTRASKPKLDARALNLGLLLANLQQKRDQRGPAAATLLKLASDFPRDPRPLLARALLQQEAGQIEAAQASLAQARGLSQGPLIAQLDQLATAWGLASVAPAAGNSVAPTPGKAVTGPVSPARTAAPASPPSNPPTGAGSP